MSSSQKRLCNDATIYNSQTLKSLDLHGHHKGYKSFMNSWKETKYVKATKVSKDPKFKKVFYKYMKQFEPQSGELNKMVARASGSYQKK